MFKSKLKLYYKFRRRKLNLNWTVRTWYTYTWKPFLSQHFRNLRLFFNVSSFLTIKWKSQVGAQMIALYLLCMVNCFRLLILQFSFLKYDTVCLFQHVRSSDLMKFYNRNSGNFHTFPMLMSQINHLLYTFFSNFAKYMCIHT